jgi:hypothetical protein
MDNVPVKETPTTGSNQSNRNPIASQPSNKTLSSDRDSILNRKELRYEEKDMALSHVYIT